MRYISDQVISFSIKTKERTDSRRVSFTTCSTGGSSFTTDIVPLIEALEAGPMYGKVYQRAPESVGETIRKKTRSPKTTEVKKTVIASVGDWQDAIEYLVNEFGCDASLLSSPEKIVEEAGKRDVEFPNLLKG